MIPSLLTRRALLTTSAALVASGIANAMSPSRSDGRLRLRVATATNPTHILTDTVQRYLDAVARAFPDDVRVELFHSGQLFSDRDVARAIYRGDLDMAAPPIMSLARIVPECGITSLPAFYSRPAGATHRVVDGPVGREIDRLVGERLGAVVAGRYVDNGHADLFFLAPDMADDAIAGLKIRVTSSAPSVLRLRALGAYPVMLPFADVPFALSQGAVDAIETGAEAVRSAQLWDAGLRLCLLQEAFLVQYVPLISGYFWARATPRLRRAMLDLWAEITLGIRETAAARQEDARVACQRNGIHMVRPSTEAIHRTRAHLAAISDHIVHKMDIDPDLARRATTIAGD